MWVGSLPAPFNSMIGKILPLLQFLPRLIAYIKPSKIKARHLLAKVIYYSSQFIIDQMTRICKFGPASMIAIGNKNAFFSMPNMVFNSSPYVFLNTGN